MVKSPPERLPFTSMSSHNSRDSRGGNGAPWISRPKRSIARTRVTFGTHVAFTSVTLAKSAGCSRHRPGFLSPFVAGWFPPTPVPSKHSRNEKGVPALVELRRGCQPKRGLRASSSGV